MSKLSEFKHNTPYTPGQCLRDMKTILDTSANTEVSLQKLSDIQGELIGKLYRMVEFLYTHGSYTK